MKTHLLGALSAVLFTFTPYSNAALVDNGGGLIYDTVLDITWAQPDIRRSWDDAVAWAAGLTLGKQGGVDATNWRLPYISVAAGAGPLMDLSAVDCNKAGELACRDNEPGYMFYHNLSGTFGQSILTSGDPDLALFPTLFSGVNWSGTEYDAVSAWGFNFHDGIQQLIPGGTIFGILSKSNGYSPWAVHAGDVVPVPAAVWLFGSGLLGLIGIARREKEA